jgi:hypothetical protein
MHRFGHHECTFEQVSPTWPATSGSFHLSIGSSLSAGPASMILRRNASRAALCPPSLPPKDVHESSSSVLK